MLRSALYPEPQSLALPMLVALALHVVALGGVLGVAGLQRDRRPIIEPDRVMEVSMVVLPKATTKMPEKASRAPVPKGAPEATTPAAASEPPPVNTSDLTIARPDAKVEAPAPPDPKAKAAERAGARDRSADRAELMRRMLIDQLAADTPEGPVDRRATDPDSTSDEAIHLAGSGVAGDPELVRYQDLLRKLFMAEFRPLPTIAASHPQIRAVVRIRLDVETGRVLGWDLVGPSGNASYDAAAERAVQAVTQVPPPPEKFRARFARFELKFTPT